MFLQEYDNIESIDLNKELWNKINVSMLQGSDKVTLYGNPNIIKRDELFKDEYYNNMTLCIDSTDDNVIVLARSYEATRTNNLIINMFCRNQDMLRELVGDGVQLIFGVPIANEN